MARGRYTKLSHGEVDSDHEVVSLGSRDQEFGGLGEHPGDQMLFLDQEKMHVSVCLVEGLGFKV